MIDSLQKKKALNAIIQMDRSFADNPEWTSGWMHNFVCPKCAATLEYKDDVSEYHKNRFSCSNCGENVSGDSYRDAWVYLYRFDYVTRLFNVAVCPENTEAIAFLTRFFDFYARNYSSFPVHGEKVGKGKIMAQSLDEAVFGIHMLRALFYCREYISPQKIKEWEEQLFMPMADFLIPQGGSIHNISVWIQCCIGMIGLVFDKKDLVDLAVRGEYGLVRQLQQGLTDDFLWREGSLHYHYYTLEALTFFCELYRTVSPKSEMLLMMKEMYRVPLKFSSDGYSLPSLNDGWYPLTLSSYGIQIIMAASITNDAGLESQVDMIRKHTPELFEDPEVIVLEDRPNRSIQVCLNDHLGIIHAPFQMLLKSGSLVPTHSHRDCLSVTIEPFSCDLGTPGYGSSINKSWYRNSLSHNTISIDGTQKIDSSKSVVRSIDGGLQAEVVPTPHNGILHFSRTLYIRDNEIVDKTVVKTNCEHVFDWTFHCDGKLSFSYPTKPVSSIGEPDLYRFFEDIHEIMAKEFFLADCIGEGREALRMRITILPGQTVYISNSPGNPASKKRRSVLLRQRGTEAEFLAVYSLDNKRKLRRLFFR